MIRNTINPLALVAFIFTSQLALSAQESQSEGDLIRQAFLAYKAAILQQQDQSAVRLVNTAMLQYYARMKALALEGQEKDVRQLTPAQKMMVLILRHRVPVGALRGMTPEEIFYPRSQSGLDGEK